MGESSKIEWTDHTFNPWWGCEKVSPACDNCYAEAWARRVGMNDLWSGARRTFGEKHWREPLKWNETAWKSLVRARVFCASMADVFDNDAPETERAALWGLIETTPHLDWLLLTKRIGNAKRMLPSSWLKEPRPNVWLGATVANQEEADRDIPRLIATPARIRFLSMEPLLEEVSLRWLAVWGRGRNRSALHPDGSTDHLDGLRQLDWVIVGGESGPRARPFVLGWGKEIVRQCREAGVPVFVKQVGAQPVNREGERCPHIRDRKGKVMDEWPEELRVREFPRAA